MFYTTPHLLLVLTLAILSSTTAFVTVGKQHQLLLFGSAAHATATNRYAAASLSRMTATPNADSRKICRMSRGVDVMKTAHDPPTSAVESAVSRRSFLNKVTTIAVGGTVLTTLSAQLAEATMMSNDSAEARVFKTGEAMGKEEAVARFKLARKDLQYLLDNYATIAAGGGDSVRRYLGTVGVTSGMYGISKVLKELQEEAEDIVEYTENMNEFDGFLRAADTACYSANFVEYSAAKTKPEKFLEDARVESERMLAAMNNMAAELHL